MIDDAELSVAVGVALHGGERQRLRRATVVDAAGAVTPFSRSGTSAANTTSGVVDGHVRCGAGGRAGSSGWPRSIACSTAGCAARDRLRQWCSRRVCRSPLLGLKDDAGGDPAALDVGDRLVDLVERANLTRDMGAARRVEFEHLA